MIAEMMSTTTIMALRLRRIKTGVITPTLVRKNTKMGSSKTKPTAKVSDTTVLM